VSVAQYQQYLAKFSGLSRRLKVVPMPPNRILCLEDNDDTCFVLQTLLCREGFEVVSAPDAEEALRLIAEKSFGLYVVDSHLPGMSGLEFCRKVRKVDGETPILIYSADAFEVDRAAGLRAGANAYLAKPNIDEIVPTVMRLLEGAATAKDPEA
jgi:DNA-binding response OmpR family regulator